MYLTGFLGHAGTSYGTFIGAYLSHLGLQQNISPGLRTRNMVDQRIGAGDEETPTEPKELTSLLDPKRRT